MTAFDWLKGLQTAMTLTALVLVLTCGQALVRRMWDRPEGYWMTMGVMLMALAALILFGWQAAQYWLYGIDRPVTVPTWLRIVAQVPYLTGGAIFVALTQRAVISFGSTFLLWSSLVAMIVIMIAFSGCVPSRP